MHAGVHVPAWHHGAYGVCGVPIILTVNKRQEILLIAVVDCRSCDVPSPHAAEELSALHVEASAHFRHDDSRREAMALLL